MIGVRVPKDRGVEAASKLKQARRAVKRPQKAHAVTDAAVFYLVLVEVAKGALVMGGLFSFVAVAVLFCLMED